MTPARHYRIRLVKGAAWSAVKIWFGPPVDPDTAEVLWERPFLWRCIINGQDDAIQAVMIELDGTTGLPVIKGDEIDEIEYLRILKTHLLATEHNLAWPEAKPREAINHLQGDLIF